MRLILEGKLEIHLSLDCFQETRIYSKEIKSLLLRILNLPFYSFSQLL